MSTTFNMFDLIFLGFGLIFVATAFLRGFVKEIFSLFNWILAFTISYFLTPPIANFLAPSFKNKLVLDIVIRVIIFIIVIIAASLSTSGLSKSLKEKMPGSFDHSLGVFYGIAKTLLVFGVVYSAVLNCYSYVLTKQAPKNKKAAVKVELPSWLHDARFFGLVKLVGEPLDPLVKKLVESVAKNVDQIIPQAPSLDDKIDEIVKHKKLEKPSEEQDSVVDDVDAGYSKKDIQKMERLIEIIDKK